MFRKTMVACALIGLASLATPAKAQEELKIGGIGTLSGGGTAWGLAVQRGIQLAIDEVAAEGGLKIGDKTYTPRLVMYDDQYTAAGGRTAAERLVNFDKVKFIIGMTGSPAVLGALPVTTPAKVLVLSGAYAKTILRNDFKAAYNYRVADTNIEFGPAMVKWLHETRPELKRVGLVAPNDAVGQVVLPPLVEAYKAAGFDVWYEMYDRGSKEFTPLLTRMIAHGVDVFDINGNAPGEAALLVKQVRQAGYKGFVWQVGGPSVDEIVAVAGPLAEGFYSLDVFDFNNPKAQEFVKNYRKKWSGIINAQTPTWYNGAKILFEAFRRAGSTDVEKVKASLENLTGYDAGLFGPVEWGGMGDYGVKHQLLLPFWIVEVKNGKAQVRAKMAPENR
jgi:branched-chain amino acid transport system substrate-binding protein